MKVNQLKTGIILSYIAMGLGIIISLIYTPIMLRILGKSEFGLYNTVSSTISTLSILSLGFGSGYVRYYAKYKTVNDIDSISKLNGLFIIIFSIMGCIALICGVFLSFNLTYIFDKGLTNNEMNTAKILMLLLTLNLAVSFPMSLFSTIINVNEKFIFLKLIGMITTVINPILTIPLLLLGFGSIGLVVTSVLLTFIINLVYIVYCKKRLKVKFIFKNFQKGLLKQLFIYTSFIAINLIVDQINLNIDKILLGRYRGTISVAVYSIGFSLYSYYVNFSTSVVSVFTPRVHLVANNENINEANMELSNLFIKVGRIQFIILAFVSTGLIFFGKVFISFWAGHGYENAYYVALLLILPGTIPLIQNLGVEIQRAKNLHKFRSIIYLVMAILNLILSIFLCQKYGEIGSAIGTAISLILANGIIMNFYYQKKIGLNIKKFWFEIIKIFPALILPIIYGIIILKFLVINSIFKLFLLIITYSILYCISMCLIGINKYEKGLLKNIFIIFKRRKK